MKIDIRWEDEDERPIVEALQRDWLLYGEMHLTNAPRGHGITRLDPRGITYTPPKDEAPAIQTLERKRG